jgi:hypothetical protein
VTIPLPPPPQLASGRQKARIIRARAKPPRTEHRISLPQTAVAWFSARMVQLRYSYHNRKSSSIHAWDSCSKCLHVKPVSLFIPKHFLSRKDLWAMK